MAFYRFNAGGPAFGIGHHEGDIVEYPDNFVLRAKALVPIIDSKGNNAGGMIWAEKEYTLQQLQEFGVLRNANPAEVTKYKESLKK